MIRSARMVVWLLPVLIVASWEVAVRTHFVPPSQAATPSDVVIRLFRLMASGPLLIHASYSMFRIALGVVLGSLIGVLTSVLVARSRTVNVLFSPTVQLLAGIPVVVWIPFWVMFFGTDEAFKIAMAAISTFFLVHLQTLQALRTVERDYMELSAIYEKTPWQRAVDVMLPSAAPAILMAIRTSLIFGWVVIFFVEYASATQGSEGLGWFIADARAMGRIEDEFAGLLFLAVIAYVCDKLLGRLQRRLLVWSDTEENAG